MSHFTMAPRGRRFVFLLIVACAVVDRTTGYKPDFKDMTKKLMMKCRNKGYPMPKMRLLHSIFNNSDLPMEDRHSGHSDTLQSAFLNTLDSVATTETKEDAISRVPFLNPDKMRNKRWNCTHLSTMIKLMRNSSGSSACYLQAFLAPLSWATLTSQGENNMDSDEYDTLLSAAKPALLSMPPKRITLPNRVKGQRMKHMMKLLQGVYDPMSQDQRIQVVNWAKEQITENYFNCSLRPPTHSRSMLDHCKPSLKWLNMEALMMMGPYLSHLAASDVDSSPKEKLCDFFHSAGFRFTLSRVTQMNPSLGRKFLKKVQACYSEQDFAQNVDKLGPLVCYYDKAPDLSPDLSLKLLSQIAECNNPRTTKMRKHLLQSVMSNSSSANASALCELGSSVTLLSPEQLSMIPGTHLKEVLKTLGPKVKWTKAQLRTLIKKRLGKKKCQNVSYEDLKELQSVMKGVPSCTLRHVKAQEILSDTEGLENISKRMRKAQLKAMLQGLCENVPPSELLQKLPGTLLRSISLSNLDKSNISSLDQVKDKTWSLPQAAFLAKKIKRLHYRRLYSILQGLTCKMIDKVAASDTRDLAQAIEETPQWLSKVQTGCAARKLFTTLDLKRPDYFKSITAEELNEIPTSLLLYMRPSTVNDLPDSVCPVFLDKMEVADLSLMPCHSPSRPALLQRALLCLANETDFSRLTIEDVSRLGPLLCELQPSKLPLMAADVLKFSLEAMASCHHIPQQHRAALIQLVNQTFGDPSDWSAETMESVGPLLLLDDDATSALPNKPWMKDVLYFLKPRMSHVSNALKKKIFDLTIATTTTSTTTSNRTSSSSSSSRSSKPVITETYTVDMIEELGLNNVYWTAQQLKAMSMDTFVATVETLGSVSGYNTEQLAVLNEKATEAFGPVSQMTESVVTQIGCIAQSFSDSELETIAFSLDSLEEIAHCGWNDSQMRSVWKSVAKHSNMTAQQLGAAEMVALNRFICGLSSSEIQQLNMDAFKDAVGSMDHIHCSLETAQQLKGLAVSAFGNPSTWNEARVSEMGNIIASLNATELDSLDPSVFSFLSRTCVTLIPPQNFATLSVAQLEALGPDNAAMVTSEQRAVLRDDGRAALQRALSGSKLRNVSENTGTTAKEPGSRAPSLDVEGISAFMKPLLFLFTAFLLL